MLNSKLVCEEIKQNFKEIHFVKSAIWVGNNFWAHPAKLMQHGCIAFVHFWQMVFSHQF
jgi:hypothetical protein